MVTREVQLQVRPSGLSFSQSSMVRAFWMLKVSSSKKNSLTSGKFCLAQAHFGSDVIGGALAPGVSAERLRPQAEGALRGAAARGVERDVGMEQEGHVVARHVHVALVNLGGPGHGVEVFHLRAVGVVEDLSVLLVADAEDLVERFALGKLDHGEIEFAAADKVER